MGADRADKPDSGIPTGQRDPTPRDGMVAPPGMSLISDAAWQAERFPWLDAVRRNRHLTAAAKLTAHAMAIGPLGNRRVARCYASVAEIATEIGASKDTAKRALRELLEQGWIIRKSGQGRGHTNTYAFLIRAQIVTLKGGNPAPIKGGGFAPVSDPEKGAGLHLGGGNPAPFYPCNIDNPRSSQDTGGPAGRAPGLSQNPNVIREAEAAVDRFRAGRHDALTGLQPWVRDHIRAADLLTEDERQAAGFAEKRIER